MKKKRNMTNKWIFPFAVIFFLCVTVIGVQMAYGAYIRRAYVKAVIATNETEKLFGSNLLYGIKNQPLDPESDDWLSVYPFTVSDSTQENITVPIKIYNYLAEDQERVNQLDVSYIISFRITGNPSTKEDGTLKGYKVNKYTLNYVDKEYYLSSSELTDIENEAKNETLPGRLPNMNTYNVTIPGSDLGKVSIVVKAKRVKNEGTGNYGTDLLYLAAKVVPNLASTVHTATVSGEFADIQNGNPEDYAAYNYNVELTGAPAAVVLRWNPTLLEIDPFFEEKYGARPESGQVIFNMEPGITKIQFYRSGDVKDKEWTDLGVTVSDH